MGGYVKVGSFSCTGAAASSGASNSVTKVGEGYGGSEPEAEAPETESQAPAGRTSPGDSRSGAGGGGVSGVTVRVLAEAN